MKTSFDVRIALGCIVFLSLVCWLTQSVSTPVAGLLIGLPVYCLIRLERKE